MGIQNDPRHTGATQPRATGYTGSGGNDQVLNRYDQADLDGESDLLHVAAANGDGGNYRECATVITQKNITLLFGRNNRNETALDCAVKANHINMALHLLDLERNRSVRSINMNEILQKTNGRSETALHEAVRKRDKSRIQVLKDQDSGLAHVLDVNGISPLYLAVSFGYGDIVDELILIFGNALSYD
uniref:Uncharacterized protein n=1 Tax=Oryza meridionalis TaxID=40149 RepID=A0A0E0D1K6_9ORYZ